MSAILDKIKNEPIVTINVVAAFLVGLGEFLTDNVNAGDGWKGLAFGVITFVLRQLVTPNAKKPKVDDVTFLS